MTDDRDPAKPSRPTKTKRSGVERVASPARRAIGSIRSGVAAATEPIVDRIEQVVDERPGQRVRRVRRRGKTPLPYLNDAHPEVRRARRVEVGLRTIPVDDIAGTAVGGGAQRGGDFLPLRPFRGRNWAGRWQRLNRAQNDLAILPPVEVVKYGGRYWVVDGHNRVALALYSGQPEIDATIMELVPPGERRTEPIVMLAPTVTGSRALRTAGKGRRPSEALGHEDDAPPSALEDEP
jgi:hypothetical protein